jgi:hypothetical protein
MMHGKHLRQTTREFGDYRLIPSERPGQKAQR